MNYDRMPPDTRHPNVARVYDYLLGGKDSFAADREAAQELMDTIPDVQQAARQNRQFLQRVVHYLVAQAGIRQILDIGTGLPTQSNVHEAAQAIAPETRVVYVDNDPVVAAHARALLAKNKNVSVVEADLRTPREIMVHPDARLIDWGERVAVLMFAILHFITDAEDPGQIVDVFKATMPPGSYLAISHATADEMSAAEDKTARDVYVGASAPVIPRTREEITGFFDGLALVPPGGRGHQRVAPARGERPDAAVRRGGEKMRTGRWREAWKLTRAVHRYLWRRLREVS